MAMTKREGERLLKKAEYDVDTACSRMKIEAKCRPMCMMGGMAAVTGIADELSRFEGLSGIKASKLGIIVSPFEDCPKGFEEIIVDTPRNKKVKLCRLDEKTRKKWAPKGKPARSGATKGALRRKRGLPRGVTLRPIPGGRD